MTRQHFRWVDAEGPAGGDGAPAQGASREKLLNSFCIGGGGTAADGATDDAIESIEKRQLHVKDAQSKGAIAGAAFATEHLRNRKEADKLVTTARDTEKITARNISKESRPDNCRSKGSKPENCRE